MLLQAQKFTYEWSLVEPGRMTMLAKLQNSRKKSCSDALHELLQLPTIVTCKQTNWNHQKQLPNYGKLVQW